MSDDTALHSAASKGDEKALRALLAAGAYEPRQLNEALMRAVISRRAAAVRLLLAHGADVNHRQSGETPLFFAVGAGLEMVRLLLDHGADARARSDSGMDPLYRYLLDVGPGARLGTADVEVVKALIDRGLDVRRPHADWQHLGAACATDRPELVTLLLESGADPNATPLALTLVGRAVQSREVRALLAALVRGGLSPDATTGPNDDDTTVLTEVCRVGDLETAQWLLDHGADPNARGRATPLSCAEQSGNPALVDLLLERGARPLTARMEAAATRALDEAESAAKARPDDPSARLEWARTLAANDFRAASAWEVHLLRRRNVAVPAALDALLSFENPAGVTWRFVPFRMEGPTLAARTDDARFPGAWVTDGQRTLPLTIAQGTPCRACDERGEQVCTSCNGTGSYSSFLDPDNDVPCEPRQRCGGCRGLKFKVTGQRLGDRGCGHAAFVDELELAPFTFRRCTTCGLGALFGPVQARPQPWAEDFACRFCARFECRCRPSPTEKELAY